jgi:arylsulfatase A-like enzyme
MSRITELQSRMAEDMIDRADRTHPPKSTLLERSDRKPDQSTVPSRSVHRLPPVMLLSIWFALVTGLLELGLVYARSHVVGWSTLSTLQVSRHFPWMIPVANLVLFLGWGLVIVALGRVWRGIGWKPSVFLLSFPACLAPLLVVPGLYPITYIAVAAGVAASIVRLTSAVPGQFCRVVTTSLPVLFVVTCLFAGWKGGQVALGEGWAISASPQPAHKGMNVLLLVMDTVRADRLSLYAYKRQTAPNLERIAARGVKFDQARATAPWTLPSHASMFTGLWPHQTGVSENHPLDTTAPTLAEFLASHGHLTAGFVANTYYCNSWFGLGRGFSHYEDFYDEDQVVSVTETLRCSTLGRAVVSLARLPLAVGRGRKTAAQINRDFLEWLSEKEDERPFFVFLNYFDAHTPYIVPEECDQHFGRRAESPADLALLFDWEKRAKQGASENDMALAADAYDDCIGYLDAQIGNLIDELDRRGLLKDTLIVITSDHGEELGEHELFGHGRSLYSQEVHVPLMIVAPGHSAAGRVVSEPVSLRDLPATFVDLLGYAHDSPFPGKSLARYWKSESGAVGPSSSPAYSEVALRDKVSKNPNRAPAWRGPMQSVVADGRAYIRNADGRAELYEIRNDPAELHDLAASAPSKAMIKLRQVVQSLLDENRP